MSESTLDIFVTVWVVLLGAVVGSFLNVVIARVPHGESVVAPRSRCPRCGSGIAWYDNIPILSWLLLRARCRTCGEPISWRYPLVEALGAAVALTAFARHGLAAGALAEFFFVALLIALAFIDLDTWLLPHALTWPLIALGLGLSAIGLTPAASAGSSALGAAVGFGSFAGIAWIGARAFGKEALGWGDVWLLGGLGAWLGIGALLPVVLFASIQGSVFGVALILLGKAQPGPAEGVEESAVPPESASPRVDDPPASKPAAPPDLSAEGDWVPPRNAVPFGPFLVAGALEWLYLAEPLGEAVPFLRIFG
ncbi:MAG TPA: prepilin peptidase [Anaeromyxobacteraceae bacterium]|nr:prepilin peptidase [Anaeromyxobacteraceae bacterium]